MVGATAESILNGQIYYNLSKIDSKHRSISEGFEPEIGAELAYFLYLYGNRAMWLKSGNRCRKDIKPSQVARNIFIFIIFIINSWKSANLEKNLLNYSQVFEKYEFMVENRQLQKFHILKISIIRNWPAIFNWSEMIRNIRLAPRFRQH